jgi:quercetin dioxygenase-like cupin family protein
MTDDTSDAAMTRLPTRATAKAASDRFTGDVWVDTITDGAQPGAARLAMVRFSPCARTGWHRHALGQTLHVTDGRGVVQTRDGGLIVLVPGDTVYTPPGVWHWHGAARDHFMTHLALADSSTDPSVPDVEWGELVTDAEYEAAMAASAERSAP